MTDELLRSDGLRQTWDILRNNPKTRDCDRLLFHEYCNKYQRNRPITDKATKLQAQIRRWRYKLQSEPRVYGDLGPSEEVKKKRQKASKYYAKGAV